MGVKGLGYVLVGIMILRLSFRVAHEILADAQEHLYTPKRKWQDVKKVF